MPRGSPFIPSNRPAYRTLKPSPAPRRAPGPLTSPDRMPLTGKSTIFFDQGLRTSLLSRLQTRMAEAERAVFRRAGVSLQTH